MRKKTTLVDTTLVFKGGEKNADHENGELKVIPDKKENGNYRHQPNGQFVNMSVNLKHASSAAGSGTDYFDD